MCDGLYPKFGGFVSAVIYQGRIAWNVGFPRYPTNLGETACDPSMPSEIPIRILIASNDATSPAPFRPSPVGGYYPKSGGYLSAIRVQNRAAWRFPMISPRSHGSRGTPICRRSTRPILGS